MPLIRMLLVLALVLPSGSFAGPKEDPGTLTEIPLTPLATAHQSTRNTPAKQKSPSAMEGAHLKSKSTPSEVIPLLGWDDEDDDLCECQKLSTGQKIGCCVATLYVATGFGIWILLTCLGYIV